MIKRFDLSLCAAALLVMTSTSWASGLSGIPTEISGQPRAEQGAASNDVERAGINIGQYVKEQVVSNAEIRPARGRETSTSVAPVQPVNRPGERPTVTSGDNSRTVAPQGSSRPPSNEPSAVQRTQQVRFVLPEGMNEIEKDQAGAASIDGDLPGTYIVKVPPLLFSRITLPFVAEVTTPFPDQVVIKHHEGALLVAPKSPMPVNLVIFHPKKPDVSVGLVLVPDGHEIPATIQIAFDPARLPESTVTAGEGERDRQITSLGIASVMTERDQRAAMRFERSADHIAVLENIHRLVSQGLVPDGFSLEVITEGAVGALCGDRRLIGQFSQRMRGERFTVDVFSVANAADDFVRFGEENCYRKGVASVQFFPSRSLAPGKTAELVIVHANDIQEAPTQQRRPMQVRIAE